MDVHPSIVLARRPRDPQWLRIGAKKHRLNPHSRFRIRFLMNRDRAVVAAMARCTIDVIVVVIGALRLFEPSHALGASIRFGRLVARSQIADQLRGLPNDLPDPTTTRAPTRQLPKQDSDDQKDSRNNQTGFRRNDHFLNYSKPLPRDLERKTIC